MWKYSKEKPLYKKVKGELEVNWDFLHSILLKQSPSDTFHEDKFVKWLRNHIRKYVPNVSIETDKIGNTYVTKGKSDVYPCIVAHTDTAQNYHENMQIVNTKTWVLAIDNNTGTQIGPGFDDKAGIYVALTLLKKFDNIKCFFPTMEEIGLIGSSRANYDWFKDCSFLAQPDRNSYNCDFISRTNGIEVCNEDFMSKISQEMAKYGYKKATGSCTDIGALKKSNIVTCPAFNYSCGYFDEHSDEEVLNCNAFSNALNFLNEVIIKEGYNEHYHIVPKEEPITDYRTYYKPTYQPSNQKELFEDYDEDFYNYNKSYSSPILNDVKHDCAGYDFNDSEGMTWVEDSLEIGQCPYCSNTELIEQVDTSLMCSSCNSIWNIPTDIKNIRYNESINVRNYY